MSDTLDSFRETEQEINRLKLEVEALKKEIALVREDAQVTQLSLEKRISELEAINKHHQKLNGELQVKLSKYEDKAAHYRRKAVL